MNNADIVKASNYIVRESCKNTSNGNWITYADEVASVVGVDECEIVKFNRDIMEEMWKRNEVLDVYFEHGGFDVMCALAYCPEYEWCEGDQFVFDCTYGEWVDRNVLPIVDTPVC